jgi:hypothetical protein
MKKQFDYCIYIAIKENTLKIGKSSYYRRYNRAYELNKQEGLVTVKRYAFSGDETKALLYESLIRSKVKKHYNAKHYNLDHFTASVEVIQSIVDNFENIMQNIEKIYKRI